MIPSLAREQGGGGFGLDGVREFLEWDGHVFRGCWKGNESRRFRAVRFHAGEFFVSCPFPVCAGVSVFVSIFVRFPFPAYRGKLGNERVAPAVRSQPTGLLCGLGQLRDRAFRDPHFRGDVAGRVQGGFNPLPEDGELVGFLVAYAGETVRPSRNCA